MGLRRFLLPLASISLAGFLSVGCERATPAPLDLPAAVTEASSGSFAAAVFDGGAAGACATRAYVLAQRPDRLPESSDPSPAPAGTLRMWLVRRGCAEPDGLLTTDGAVALAPGAFAVADDEHTATLLTGATLIDAATGAAVHAVAQIAWTVDAAASGGFDASWSAGLHRLTLSARAPTVSASVLARIAVAGADLPLGAASNAGFARHGEILLREEWPAAALAGAPAIVSFSARPRVVVAGAPVRLAWQLSGAEGAVLTLDPGAIDVTGRTGIEFLAPGSSTSYRLTAADDLGQDVRWARLTVVAGDAMEPNDTPDSATRVTAGRFGRTDLSLTPGDVDWFTFTVAGSGRAVVAARLYDATVVGGSMADAHIGLFDAWLAPVASDPWTVAGYLPAGTYYVAVSAAADGRFTGAHDVTGLYAMSVDEPLWPAPDPWEPNDTPEQAASLPTSPAELTLLPHDVDWFVLTTEVTGEFEAYLVPESDTVKPRAALFDVAGDRLSAGWNGHDAFWWSDLAPGRYRLAVSDAADIGFDGGHDTGGAYALRTTFTAMP